mmetsp:Transcript_16575/g.23274  ORF Transcript_16575/g.23274 Transcript_16575/m.23274 type:complete len:274 (+) Transcript_16575:390-1211(+)
MMEQIFSCVGNAPHGIGNHLAKWFCGWVYNFEKASGLLVAIQPVHNCHHKAHALCDNDDRKKRVQPQHQAVKAGNAVTDIVEHSRIVVAHGVDTKLSQCLSSTCLSGYVFIAWKATSVCHVAIPLGSDFNDCAQPQHQPQQQKLDQHIGYFSVVCQTFEAAPEFRPCCVRLLAITCTDKNESAERLIDANTKQEGVQQRNAHHQTRPLQTKQFDFVKAPGFWASSFPVGKPSNSTNLVFPQSQRHDDTHRAEQQYCDQTAYPHLDSKHSGPSS